MDRYHANARPDTGPEGALSCDPKSPTRWRLSTARAARKQLRDKRRQWIAGAGAVPATTPMWTSRPSWLTEIAAWTESARGAAVLAERNLRPALLLRVAEAMAEYADHATGRHCAATNATIATAARCSPRTVTTVRIVLREAGLAVEVRRGTGSTATPHNRRRPSVWHLISRAQPVDNAPVCDLPPSLCDWRCSYVGKRSPSVRPRTPRQNPSKHRPKNQRAPRPLHLQRIAAGIVAGGSGLDAAHPGQICEALARSGLDLTAWSAPQILRALNADMRKMGWTWPDHIERPGAFLASRLRRLPPAPRLRAPQPKPTAAAKPPPAPAATAESRATAIAYFRTHRASREVETLKPADQTESHRRRSPASVVAGVLERGGSGHGSCPTAPAQTCTQTPPPCPGAGALADGIVRG